MSICLVVSTTFTVRATTFACRSTATTSTCRVVVCVQYVRLFYCLSISSAICMAQRLNARVKVRKNKKSARERENANCLTRAREDEATRSRSPAVSNLKLGSCVCGQSYCKQRCFSLSHSVCLPIDRCRLTRQFPAGSLF